MLAHARIKMDAFVKSETPLADQPLHMLFRAMTEFECRRERSRSPAQFFSGIGVERTASTKEVEVCEEDIAENAERKLVAKYFDGKQFKAVKLWSDGDWTLAEHYDKGANGMVLARWDDGSSLELLIPNSCLAEDGTLKRYEPPPKPTPKAKGKVSKKRPAANDENSRDKKKPAAAGDVEVDVKDETKNDEVGHNDFEKDPFAFIDAMEGDGQAKVENDEVGDNDPDNKNLSTELGTSDQNEGDGQEEHGEEEKPETDEIVEPEPDVTFRVAPGHNGAYVVFACTDAADKAQILEVSLKQVNPYKCSPREVCNWIAENDENKKWINYELDHPVKADKEGLTYIRVCMQQKRLDAFEHFGFK